MIKEFSFIVLFLIVFQSCSKKNNTEYKIGQKQNEYSFDIESYRCDKLEVNAQGEIFQTAVSSRKPVINFSCLEKNYSDEEIAAVKNIDLSNNIRMLNLKGVDKFFNLEKLNLYGKEIVDISDLYLLKKLKFFTLKSPNLKNVSMQDLPENLEGIYLYCPIQNDITFTEENRNLKYISLTDESIKIKKINGFENLKGLLFLNLLYCPLENPEELLKLKGLKYEIDFTVSRDVSKTRLDTILKELKKNNPDCTRVFACYFDETEKIENEFISPE